MLDRRPIWQSATLAFFLYLLGSMVLIGHGTYAHFGSTTVGYASDPPLFLWTLEWWPRALLDGFNILHPEVVYAPEGFDVALITAIPAPSLVLAPVTLLAGPLASYNVLMIAIPAVNGWAAYLLCRAAGASGWPSFAGGYLFAFSSYVLSQTLGHPNLSLVAMVPLAAYLLLRRQQGAISAKAYVIGLTAVLAFQFLTSTEVFLTMALIGTMVFLLALALFPAERAGLLDTGLLTVLAFALTGILVAPYLISFLTTDQSLNHVAPAEFVTDPVNLVVPTRVTVGGSHLYSISGEFTSNLTENAAYVGIPLLLVLVSFAWQRRRQAASLLLVLAFTVAFVASLGPTLTVLGDPTGLSLPWKALAQLPLIEYVLPQRMIVFAWLALAVIVALWLSADGRLRSAKWALVIVGLVLLLPDPRATDPDPAHRGAAIWSSRRPLPPLFANGDSALFRGRPNILVLPYNEAGDGNGTYWQANTGMAFTMPGGYVSGTVPDNFACWEVVEQLRREGYPDSDPGEFLDFLAAKKVDFVVAQDAVAGGAAPLLELLHQPGKDVGGTVIYRVPRHRGPVRVPSTCEQ